jgi:dimethylargininase
MLHRVTAQVPRFGGHSSTAPMRDVVVSRPGPAFGRAFDDASLGFLRPVDLAVAQREHDAFTDLLARLAVRVHLLPDEPDLAEAVYTYDPLMITDAGAIALRPGKEPRRPEVDKLVAWTDAAGIPTAGRIDAPGTVEGGDVVWVRENLLCIGRTLRTNRSGAAQLAALIEAETMIVDLPYWRGSDELIHLMSVISPVADDLAVVYLPLLPVGLWELLGELGIRTIDVPAEEYPTLGCNVLPVRPGVVIVAEGNPRTAAALASAGCEVHTYPATEVGINGGGGPTCMTRAAWRDTD